MARQSQARLGVLEDWELVDHHGPEIVAGCNVLSMLINVDRVDVSSVVALREDTHDFPSKLASSRLPHGWINQGVCAVSDLVLRFDVEEELLVGLIDGSKVSPVS